jgi:glutamine synthetase
MEEALQFAEKTYVDVNIHKAEHREKLESLNQLPASCWDSAEELSIHRNIFENHGVFPAAMIDDIIKRLKSYQDRNVREEIKKRPERMMELVGEYFHCG